MVTLRTLETAIELNTPRRVMRYVLVYCSSGNIDLIIDDMDLSLKAGEVITVTSGQIHFLNAGIYVGFFLQG